MKRFTISSVLGLAAIGATLGTTPAAPVPGPGGVYDAVVELCRALDQQDHDYLARAFVDSRHGLEFYTDAEGQLATREASGAFEFIDHGADGTALGATTQAELKAGVAGFADSKLGAPKSSIHRVYADCPSGSCSYAVVEFDRSWGEGESRRVVPMRATALLAHRGDRAPHFRVFHWHAAPR